MINEIEFRTRLTNIESENQTGKPFSTYFDMPVSTYISQGSGRKDNSSFAFKSSTDTTIKIYGGIIAWSGRSLIIVPDDAESGTIGGPGYVSLKVPSDEASWGTYELVFTSTYPVDAGGFFYKALHQVDLDEDGNAKWVKSRRDDWVLRSPI